MSARQHTAVPVLHHVHELRSRLLKVILVMTIGSVIGFIYRGPLIAIMQNPLGEKLYYTSPGGSFDFVIKLSLLIGFLLALPILIYQVVAYIEPAFPKALNKRLTFIVVTASSLLAAAGVFFGFTVSLPSTLAFFHEAGVGQLEAIITADQYFSFICSYLAIFAAIFQLPLVLLLINFFTPLSPRHLKKARKFVIVGAFGLAIITPGAQDPITQSVMALPVIVLYEFSGLMLWFINRNKRPQGTKVLQPVPQDHPARSSAKAQRIRKPIQQPDWGSTNAEVEHNGQLARVRRPITPPVRPLGARVDLRPQRAVSTRNATRAASRSNTIDLRPQT